MEMEKKNCFDGKRQRVWGKCSEHQGIHQKIFIARQLDTKRMIKKNTKKKMKKKMKKKESRWKWVNCKNTTKSFEESNLKIGIWRKKKDLDTLQGYDFKSRTIMLKRIKDMVQDYQGQW